jgi:hypothetical protein
MRSMDVRSREHVEASRALRVKDAGILVGKISLR